MTYREAHITDIEQLHITRNSVIENILTNPDLVTYADYLEFITKRGKGWVCEVDGTIVGFSIVDLKENNVWAIFVHPEFERKGIGRKLHDLMLSWYFNQTYKKIWLGTDSGTRAEMFYRKSGWTEVGIHGKGEIKFEMTAEEWRNRSIKG
jgi:GNAT superfamily N-acetyltransferase